jgi:hypothetical protein
MKRCSVFKTEKKGDLNSAVQASDTLHNSRTQTLKANVQTTVHKPASCFDGISVAFPSIMCITVLQRCRQCVSNEVLCEQQTKKVVFPSWKKGGHSQPPLGTKEAEISLIVAIWEKSSSSNVFLLFQENSV